MAWGTERVSPSLVATPVHSSVSDLSRVTQSRLASSYLSRSSFCSLSNPSVVAFADLNSELCVASAALIDSFALSTMALPPWENHYVEFVAHIQTTTKST